MHVHAENPASRMTGVLSGAMAVTLGLVAAEFVGGYLGHSIAVISDGVHNLTDIPTMAISWLAVRWAERPPDHEKTYGYHRAAILAAFVNSLCLVLVALCIFWEAFQRLRHPVEVHEGTMLGVGLLALAVNCGITLALLRGRRDLNLRSVLIHNFGDALSNIAILVGAVAIRYTGVHWVDPAIGLAIGALVLGTSYGVLKESSHILLEGLPREILLADVVGAILSIEGVQEVHDIHIWTLGTDLHALSCHVRIPDMHMQESEQVLVKIKECLAREFHITHTTIQFERAGLPASAGYFMPEPFKTSSK